MSGVRSGVNGTPTFFINGVRYDGSWEESELLQALQHAAGGARH
jgi:protein-disulfide isomerase